MPLTPGPHCPAAQVPMKRQLYPLSPSWEVMQIPGIPGNGPNVPPRAAGEVEGSTVCPSLLKPFQAARAVFLHPIPTSWQA